MKLTERLQCIADMVRNTEGTIADVGTDHGLIPIYLAGRFPKRRIYAMDVRSEPLQRARDNAAEFGMAHKIEFCQSDGLKACLGEPLTTLIIAGMGGILMERILDEGKSCLTKQSELILSPHGNPDLVRKILHQLGFAIIHERYVKEAGQIYLILYAVWGKDEIYSEADYRYGKEAKTTDRENRNDLLAKEQNELEGVKAHLQTLPENPAVEEKIADLTRQILVLKEKRMDSSSGDESK